MATRTKTPEPRLKPPQDPESEELVYQIEETAYAIRTAYETITDTTEDDPKYRTMLSFWLDVLFGQAEALEELAKRFRTREALNDAAKRRA